MLDSTYPNKLYNECRILWESVSFGCGTTPCQVTGGWTAIILVLLVQCLLMVQAFHQRIRPIAFQACYSIPSIRSEIQKKMGSLKSKRNQPPNQFQPINAMWRLAPPTLYHANWRNAVRLRIKCSCLRSEIGYQGKVPLAPQTVHLLPLCLPDLISYSSDTWKIMERHPCLAIYLSLFLPVWIYIYISV